MISSITEPHLRHPHQNERNKDVDVGHETFPLLRHFSMDERPDHGDSERIYLRRYGKSFVNVIFCLLIVLLLIMSYIWVESMSRRPRIIPIEQAEEHMVDVDDGIQVWFRTWGNRNGVPVLFVHGGPGQAVVDYHNGNKRFFDASECFVVEVDQRGTGFSQPSVRDDWRNMKYYKNISLDVIAADFEVVRKHLGILKWMVWGGSYGSTVGLNYAMRYPDNCIALLLRGIYLDTTPELYEIYSRKAFEKNPKRLAQFERLLSVANEHVLDAGEEPLDPYDPFRLIRVYERMITKGNKKAIWEWHSFEVNLMEEDKKNMLDPDTIEKKKFPEAQSVAFFETRLWLHGTVEEPSNLLQRVDRLSDIPIWICQGLRDEVCPPQNARHLVDALEDTESPVSAKFVKSGHEDTDPVMATCLKEIMDEFLDFYNGDYIN